MSNITETKNGLIEKSSGRRIESPLDMKHKKINDSIGLKCRYFVAFQYRDTGVFGNAYFEADTPIETFNDVVTMTKTFQDRGEDIAIINWIRLKDNIS